MDEADITAARAEYDHVANLERSRKPEAPKHTTHCLECGAPVTAPRRWCDRYCRDDWERRQTR